MRIWGIIERSDINVIVFYMCTANPIGFGRKSLIQSGKELQNNI